ncbi:hypothetical protein Agabi119p4_2241 [Agaricus bisporus var. burnettii]|uniref:Uncharacterized protein n=1 Tax=Agaricus bisporus var. burnettii TaxID=192524 RepID=A0A8H7KK71_AGABI|nr:hypothetical protein Agabi119p4_2241 [Agaricus bisporus var. burnettii]
MERPRTTQGGDYSPLPSGPQENYTRQGEDDSGELEDCCESAMRKLAIGISSTVRRGDDEPVMEMESGRSTRSRARRVGPSDKRREKLFADIERIQGQIAERNERNARRRKRLEELKAQDDAEKWEDELYQTRVQELNEARVRIETSSSTSTQDIFQGVLQLNEEISRTASEIIRAAAPLSVTERHGLNIPHVIRKTLGKAFLFLFQSDEDHVLEDKQLVQAVLQIFLARSCAELIDCWTLGSNYFNHGMDKLYDRILQKETQMIAGKWRQLAFGKMPIGWNLQKHADHNARDVLQILGCAGWGGLNNLQVQPLIKELMVMADQLRKNVKMDMIGSDLRPWVALYNAKYHPVTMKDVANRFGMERTTGAERFHVLGSTALGLKAYQKVEGSTPRLTAQVVYQTKVLCVEPLRGRSSGTKTPIPRSDSTSRHLSRGRSFSMS